jgi:peptidoglycan/xylan/chitin deacetylase (PgdA/CDA1 family)
MSILCYHAVDPRWESTLSLTPAEFERQCEWLARRRSVIPLQDAVAALDPSFRLPRGRVSITFDDGFEELYHHAVPRLRAHNLTATVFVVAATLTPEGHDVDWVDTPPPWKLQTLSLDQILELEEYGIRSESHSWAHHDLTTLTEEECFRDLSRSRELLEELLGRPVRFLAFPRGRHAPHVRRAAARAGYAFAFSLPDGPEPVEAHAVPRVGVHRGNGLGALAIKSSRWYLRMRLSKAVPLAHAR